MKVDPISVEGAIMPKHLLIVDEDLGQERPRRLQAEELDAVLAQVIRANQGERNLVEWMEEGLIRVALEQASHKKSRAARQLGMHRKQ